jgi:cold shock CspA family protein
MLERLVDAAAVEAEIERVRSLSGVLAAVFVHISAVEKAGLSGLNEGQIVEYDEVPNKGKTSAENLKVQR